MKEYSNVLGLKSVYVGSNRGSNLCIDITGYYVLNLYNQSIKITEN